MLRAWLIVCSFSGLITLVPGRTPAASRHDVPPALPPPGYEAVIDHLSNGDITDRDHLIYSPGLIVEAWRWHLPAYLPRQHTALLAGRARHLLIFFGGDPPITWDYDPTSKTAEPTSPSCMVALRLAAWRHGEWAVRREYRVPGFYLPGHLAISPAGVYAVEGGPVPRIEGFRLLPEYAQIPAGFRKLGREAVCGRECQVYLDDRSPAARRRYWIDPKLHVALREETLFTPPPGTRFPPQRASIVVTSFRVLGHRSPGPGFPPGATVVLPELLRNIRLPAGIRRTAMKGPHALTGLDFNQLAGRSAPSTGGGTSTLITPSG